MKELFRKIPGFRSGTRTNQIFASVYYLIVIGLYGSVAIFSFSMSAVIGGMILLMCPYIIFRAVDKMEAKDKVEIEAKKKKI
ncbi:MAG: hypothetical protein ACRCX8_18210 [Sarcina sp.]